MSVVVVVYGDRDGKILFSAINGGKGVVCEDQWRQYKIRWKWFEVYV